MSHSRKHRSDLAWRLTVGFVAALATAIVWSLLSVSWLQGTQGGGGGEVVDVPIKHAPGAFALLQLLAHGYVGVQHVGSVFGWHVAHRPWALVPFVLALVAIAWFARYALQVHEMLKKPQLRGRIP